ncbi:MAG: winged helix DNA-binding protein, partial [Myxococcales bacterium]|nr:winged helix DNA-binding protein [Myxococcales bacterium]
ASRNLSGLESAGLITRKKGAQDGRQTDVRLTPRGRRAADSVSSAAMSAYGAILERIPRGERARLIDALDTLARSIDAG